jgi:hypothetical protein
MTARPKRASSNCRGRAFGAGSTLAVLLGGTTGEGLAQQEDTSCFVAPVEAQQLQRSGHLRAAWAQFSRCAASSCPREIAHECARWAQEVAQSQPSIVIGARDAQGHDLDDASVSIDDAPAVGAGATAMPLDPGLHVLVFHRAGSADVVERIVLREGEKDREVLAVMAVPRRALALTTAAPGANGVAAKDEPARGSVLAWVFTAIGGVGLAGFATLGGIAVDLRGKDHCDAQPGCSPSSAAQVRSMYLAADVSLGISAAAVVAAVGVFLARPNASRGPGLVVAPGAPPPSVSWGPAGIVF